MTIRTMQQSDAEQLRSHWNCSVHNDPLSAQLLHEKVWADPDFDPQLTRVKISGGHVLGWGMAVYRGPPTNRAHLKFLVVDSSVQRQGIGSEILSKLEQELKRLGCGEIRIDEAAPNYLNPGIDESYQGGIAFLQKHGYREIGKAVHQRVNLADSPWATDADEARLRAEGITIARAQARDRDTVMEWLAVHWPAWMAEVSRAFANDPLTLHLAWRGEQVIGFAAYDTNNLGIGWFGPMGTDPTCRGLGIGRILLWRCLADQRQQGYAHSIIPWVGPVEFYRQHANASIWRTFCRMSKK